MRYSIEKMRESKIDIYSRYIHTPKQSKQLSTVNEKRSIIKILMDRLGKVRERLLKTIRQ